MSYTGAVAIAADSSDEVMADPTMAAPAVPKREREELYDAGSDDDFTAVSAKATEKKSKKSKPSDVDGSDTLDPTAQVYAAELRPSPYFYYRDHSTEPDEDPLTPVTAAGHVPCFPAKMHAILASPDLNDVVAWDDHGRSFRILKPKRFECYILPRFFDHSKFSSFIRQANGWGFRRFLSGPNRNSYYQEYFLRSMPWLCKKMRRPKVGEKKGVSPEHEPDLRLISQEFPVPNHPITREIQIVLETIKQGPRARMPVHWAVEQLPPAAQLFAGLVTQDKEQEKAESKVAVMPNPQAQAQAQVNPFGMGMGALNFNALQIQNPMANSAPTNVDVAMTNYLLSLQQSNPNALMMNAPTNGFAAGFRAATQYHNESVRSILANAFARGAPVPLVSGSSGIPGQQVAGLGAPLNPNPQATADCLRLMQLQMTQGKLGGQGRNGANLTLEQLHAYQTGMRRPSMPPSK